MRVGAGLGFVFVTGMLVPLARCGEVGPSPVDAAADADAAPKSCSGYSASECPAGYACFFPITEGCNAKGHCLPGKAGACQPYGCPCRWGFTVGCGPAGYVTTPVPFLDGDICGQEGCSGLACELCDVSGYSPTTMSTPVAVTNACTPAQMTDVVAACLDANATQQTCDAWRTANAPDAGGGNCVACLFTSRSAAAWGPLVCDTASCSLNHTGCLDMVLAQVSQEKAQGGAGSCGDLLSDAYGCQDYACSTCSKAGAAGQTYYDMCEMNAVADECKSYADAYRYATQCASLQGDAAPPAVSNCFPQSQADIPKLLNVFCGTGP